jgi:hypothetical protein
MRAIVALCLSGLVLISMTACTALQGNAGGTQPEQLDRQLLLARGLSRLSPAACQSAAKILRSRIPGDRLLNFPGSLHWRRSRSVTEGVWTAIPRRPPA